MEKIYVITVLPLPTFFFPSIISSSPHPESRGHLIALSKKEKENKETDKQTDSFKRDLYLLQLGLNFLLLSVDYIVETSSKITAS